MAVLNKVVGERFSTRAGFKSVGPVLSKWVPHLKGVPGKCRQS